MTKRHVAKVSENAGKRSSDGISEPVTRKKKNEPSLLKKAEPAIVLGNFDKRGRICISYTRATGKGGQQKAAKDDSSRDNHYFQGRNQQLN